MQELEQEIAGLDEEIRQGELYLAQQAVITEAQATIAGHEAQQKDLGQIYEVRTAEQDLLDRFTQQQSRMLEGKINTHFATIRVQLLDSDDQPACIVLLDGVPWADLNHGGQMLAGLDILSVLQQGYQSLWPVWIDGKESYTGLPTTEGQTLQLVASVSHPVLGIYDELPSA